MNKHQLAIDLILAQIKTLDDNVEDLNAALYDDENILKILMSQTGETRTQVLERKRGLSKQIAALEKSVSSLDFAGVNFDKVNA